MGHTGPCWNTNITSRELWTHRLKDVTFIVSGNIHTSALVNVRVDVWDMEHMNLKCYVQKQGHNDHLRFHEGLYVFHHRGGPLIGWWSGGRRLLEIVWLHTRVKCHVSILLSWGVWITQSNNRLVQQLLIWIAALGYQMGRGAAQGFNIIGWCHSHKTHYAYSCHLCHFTPWKEPWKWG